MTFEYKLLLALSILRSFKVILVYARLAFSIIGGNPSHEKVIYVT